ncbi:MAG: DegV family protein [Dehalococcoidales bacterium]|nr:DegV family protein [Dehalococcoidales bacterium]
MNTKIVTDSTADLPPQIAGELGITVVPAYVNFGDESYRDRVDISEDVFYRKLSESPVHPDTVPPTPEDFAEVYHRLSREADGIISIHLSGRLSATINSATRAKAQVAGFPVEIIDSQSVTMGVGLLAVFAGELAAAGLPPAKIAGEVRKAVPHIRILGYLDTLKYLSLGGRIGKAKALLGSVMSVKPLLTMKDGEVEPVSKVRSRDRGIERLVEFVNSTKNIQDLAVVHSTTPDDAQLLAERIGSTFTREKIKLARLGPVLGVHSGPGILFVALRTGNG